MQRHCGVNLKPGACSTCCTALATRDQFISVTTLNLPIVFVVVFRQLSQLAVKFVNSLLFAFALFVQSSCQQQKHRYTQRSLQVCWVQRVDCRNNTAFLCCVGEFCPISADVLYGVTAMSKICCIV
jgi:hypothetical protein